MLVSCSNKPEKQLSKLTESNTEILSIQKKDDTTKLNENTSEINERIKWFTEQMEFLPKETVDTILQHSNISTIKKSNWNIIKKAYSQWRKQELKKGYFMAYCPVYNDSIGSYKDYIYDYEGEDTGLEWGGYGGLRYAVPEIPDEFSREFDVFKVDINFDEKQDVIFRILPIDCINGLGTFSMHPPIYVSLVSNGNKYEFDNSLINRVITATKDFSKKFQNHDFHWLEIKDITNQNGVLVISGDFMVYLENDASCCPSINPQFSCYIDKTGKGYLDMEVVYKPQSFPEDIEARYNIKLRLK